MIGRQRIGFVRLLKRLKALTRTCGEVYTALMDRRNFLQGVFGGVAATGLIIAAKPNDIEAFAGPLRKGAPLLLDKPTVNPKVVTFGEHLYNSRGEVVAYVTDISVIAEKLDVTGFSLTERYSDTGKTFVQGLPNVEIRAIAVGRIEIEAIEGSGISMPRLRGSY